MAVTTYAELQTALDNWLARTDLQSRHPEFIALAEARMNRELETRGQAKRVTTTTTADDAYVTVRPSRYCAISHQMRQTARLRQPARESRSTTRSRATNFTCGLVLTAATQSRLITTPALRRCRTRTQATTFWRVTLTPICTALSPRPMAFCWMNSARPITIKYLRAR